MKLNLESTSTIVEINGVAMRVWSGASEGGLPVHAFIARIGAAPGADVSELERELRTLPADTRAPVADDEASLGEPEAVPRFLAAVRDVMDRQVSFVAAAREVMAWQASSIIDAAQKLRRNHQEGLEAALARGDDGDVQAHGGAIVALEDVEMIVKGGLAAIEAREEPRSEARG